MATEGSSSGGDTKFFIVLGVLVLAAGILNGGFTSSGGESGGSLLSRERDLYESPRTKEEISRDLGVIAGDIEDIGEDLEYIERYGEPSSYEDFLSFGYGGANSNDPSREYLTISYSNSAKEKLLFTGFEVESASTGKGAFIPKAVYLPFTDNNDVSEHIYLSPGDTVYVTTGKSPIGFSFRVNKCMGYFTQFNNFTPGISRSCPLPEDEKLPKFPNHLDDRCLDYIEGLPACYIPINTLPIELSKQCVNWVVENVNYASCVKNHKSDPDFYSKEWRVYIGHESELWKQQREAIKLLDLGKRLVDVLEY